MRLNHVKLEQSFLDCVKLQGKYYPTYALLGFYTDGEDKIDLEIVSGIKLQDYLETHIIVGFEMNSKVPYPILLRKKSKKEGFDGIDNIKKATSSLYEIAKKLGGVEPSLAMSLKEFIETYGYQGACFSINSERLKQLEKIKEFEV